MAEIAWKLFKYFGAALAFYCLVILFFPINFRSREYPRRASCQSQLKQIAIAVKQYSIDYDERFPARATNWSQPLSPYMKDMKIFQCPSVKETNAARNDYFFNARLFGLQIPELPHPISTIESGDGDIGALSTLPPQWKRDETSPAFRHLGGANYAFADGHVKWLKPIRINGAWPNGKNATFAIQ